MSATLALDLQAVYQRWLDEDKKEIAQLQRAVREAEAEAERLRGALYAARAEANALRCKLGAREFNDWEAKRGADE